MKIGDLEFRSAKEHADLLSVPTKECLLNLPSSAIETVGVAKIDFKYIAGAELCAHYHIDPSIGGNCIVVEASRGKERRYVACLVPVQCRMDLNGFVRKYLHARRVSLAPKDEVTALSGMKYGSINIVGLPKEWAILVDASLAAKPVVVMGSGIVQSKIDIPGSMLQNLPNAEVVEGLGILVA